MNTENVSALRINKLSKEQFERELEAGRLKTNEMYLVPDEPAEPVPDEPSGWIDATLNIDYIYGEGDFLRYMRCGKIVYYSFAIVPNGNLTDTWEDYIIGTGLPAPANGESAMCFAVDCNTNNAYTHYVSGGNLILRSGAEAFTDGHFFYGSGSYIAQD